MQMDRKTTVIIGTSLIVLGMVMAFGLWGLLPVLGLSAAGAYLYTERRRVGRIGAAVQSGLWLIGLAVLFLIEFVMPGIIILAGLSLLARGREAELDAQLVRLLAKLGVQVPGIQMASAAPVAPVQSVPTLAAQPPAQPPVPTPPAPPVAPAPPPTVQPDERATTGETIRL
ncbi:MAG: hypothetical protein HC911_06735 [Chloroflexaceae bacterium]|nr:hypothetical protein [Chloroflexaceae bacterium]